MANTLAYYIDKLVIYNIMGLNYLDSDRDYIEKFLYDCHMWVFMFLIYKYVSQASAFVNAGQC